MMNDKELFEALFSKEISFEQMFLSIERYIYDRKSVKVTINRDPGDSTRMAWNLNMAWHAYLEVIKYYSTIRKYDTASSKFI